MNERDILMETIRKLFDLKISDAEIMGNLVEAGISEEQATKLIAEAKSSYAPQRQGQKKGIRFEEQAVEELPQEFKEKKKSRKQRESEEQREIEARKELGEIPEVVAVDEKAEGSDEGNPEEKNWGSASGTGTESGFESKSESKAGKDGFILPPVAPQPTPEAEPLMAELWKQGIITAVNQKFEEMEKIRSEIEEVIDKKIEKSLEGELEKIKAVFDAQKTLVIEKTNSALESKSSEIAKKIEERISKLKEIDSEIKHDLEKVEKANEMNARMANSVSMKLEEISKTKSELVREMNSELIKSKSELEDYRGQVETFLKDAQLRLAGIDQRLNSTLQLQSRIAESVLKEARDKIDKLALQKNQQLEQQLQSQISEVLALKQKIDPQKLESEFHDLFALKEVEWNKQVQNKIAEIEKIKKELDPAELLEKMRDLDQFKEQFVQVVDKSIDEVNELKARLEEYLKQVKPPTAPKQEKKKKSPKELREAIQSAAKESAES